MPTVSAASALELLDLVSAPVNDARAAPRALAVFAHPDDEVIALGARLSRHRQTVFVCVTDGAPQDGVDAATHAFAGIDEYREARGRELKTALRRARIPAQNLRQLGIPDQQAAFRLQQITVALRNLVRELRPEVVLTHPYEGGHPDHDACAFAVHFAIQSIASPDIEPLPVVVEAAFYHAGPNGIETGCFLPGHEGVPEVTRALNEEERRTRDALLDAFVSQRDTLQYFRIDVERYRIAPIYDFCSPPHPGVLFYEHHPWGMAGARFCHLINAAMQSIEEFPCDSRC
jgi:N-acetylglucosamine malate deacetylase 2